MSKILFNGPVHRPSSPAAMLGLCYYRLGLFRDAERQLGSAFKDTPMPLTALLLGKVRLLNGLPVESFTAMHALKFSFIYMNYIFSSNPLCIFAVYYLRTRYL